MKRKIPFSYFALYLLKYLIDNNDERAKDNDFIIDRADLAAETKEQCRLNGMTPDQAHEQAMAVLMEGL